MQMLKYNYSQGSCKGRAAVQGQMKAVKPCHSHRLSSDVLSRIADATNLRILKFVASAMRDKTSEESLWL